MSAGQHSQAFATATILGSRYMPWLPTIFSNLFLANVYALSSWSGNWPVPQKQMSQILENSRKAVKQAVAEGSQATDKASEGIC